MLAAGKIFKFIIASLVVEEVGGTAVGSPSVSGISEGEHVEHRSRLYLLQLRRCIDEPLVPGAAQADQNGDVLLAVDRKGHRRCVDAVASIELPEFLQGL